MKTRKRLVVLGVIVLFLMALSVLPRIIEAKWSNPAATAVNATPGTTAAAQGRKQEVVSGISVRNDTSIPMREMKQKPYDGGPKREANTNPKISHFHKDAPDRVIQRTIAADEFTIAAMPSVEQNFDGIPFPGVSCNCAPPDTVGEVGDTQYVQRPLALPCLARQTLRPSGRALAAFVKTTPAAIRWCFTINSPTVGWSLNLPASPSRPTSASRFQRPPTQPAHIIVTIFISAPTFSTIRT
jgi:hypothetical protein